MDVERPNETSSTHASTRWFLRTPTVSSSVSYSANGAARYLVDRHGARPPSFYGAVRWSSDRLASEVQVLIKRRSFKEAQVLLAGTRADSASHPYNDGVHRRPSDLRYRDSKFEYGKSRRFFERLH